MNKTLQAFVLILFYIISPLEIVAQTRWVEQWIAMGSETPQLSEVWLEDSQKNILEKRTIELGGKTRENWLTLTRMEYSSDKIIKTELYSKKYEKGKDPIMTVRLDYNDNSLKTRSSIYNHSISNSKKPVLFTTYTYDNNSNLLSETTTFLIDYYGKPTEPQVVITRYRYKDTLLIEEWKIAPDSSTSERYSFKYDSKGNRIEKRLMDEIDYLEKQLYIFKYDESGKLIEDKTLFNDGNVFRSHKYVYNKTNDLVEQLEYGAESQNPIVRVTYKYEVINNKTKNTR